MRHHAPSRRAVLAGGALAAAVMGLSGCRGSDWYPSEVTPDEYLLRSVIAEKERLVARYTATLNSGTADDPGLYEELRGHHERHLAVLRDRLPERDGPEPEVSALPETPSPRPPTGQGSGWRRKGPSPTGSASSARSPTRRWPSSSPVSAPVRRDTSTYFRRHS